MNELWRVISNAAVEAGEPINDDTATAIAQVVQADVRFPVTHKPGDPLPRYVMTGDGMVESTMGTWVPIEAVQVELNGKSDGIDYDFDKEAGIVCDAIGSNNGRMTVNCALHEAYAAGEAAANAKKHFLNARFHIEGGKLVKTTNGQPVPPDEPTFILRGRDMLALPTLATYYKLAEADNCNFEFKVGVMEAMNGFARFAFDQSNMMKQPGVTRGK